MKSIAYALIALIVIPLATTGAELIPQSVDATRNVTSMPLAFTENRGQWDEQVLYRTNAGGATMWFTKNGAVYQFTRSISKEVTDIDELPGPIHDPHDREPVSIESIAIRASFIGANPNPQITGIDAMEYKCNYFIGNDPNEWHTDVPNYNAITYEETYSGIDLKYYGNGKRMEYDFIVSPGADYSQIQIRYEGAESISTDDNGQLVVRTQWGEIVEQRPIFYQVENGSRIAVAGKYRLMGNSSFGFEVSSNFDQALPLVIDPVLFFSIYVGEGLSDFGYGISVDAAGNAYVTGKTASAGFPTSGDYQTFQAGYDAFVIKLNSSGNAPIYSTYLGGSGADEGWSVSVDDSGNAYVTGATASVDFPTVGEYQTDQAGDDVFVTKLNSSGNVLVYSTYLGGTGNEEGWSIAVGDSGDAYVTGYTASTDFPTVSEYQSDQVVRDAFVTRLSSSGDSLVYSTYLGGGNSDYGQGIAVDSSGSAYVTGQTSSTDFPTVGEFQADSAYTDVFVTKLTGSGNVLVYSTYLGGMIWTEAVASQWTIRVMLMLPAILIPLTSQQWANTKRSRAMQMPM